MLLDCSSITSFQTSFFMIFYLLVGPILFIEENRNYWKQTVDIILVWTRYHVPRSWFKPSGNILVIFEEKGGDPTKITFSRRKISSVCALVSEDYPVANLESFQKSGNGNSSSKASVHLKCPKTSSISIVKFASFGSPTGACGSYSQGECHDPTSLPVVEKVNFLFFNV